MTKRRDDLRLALRKLGLDYEAWLWGRSDGAPSFREFRQMRRRAAAAPARRRRTRRRNRVAADLALLAVLFALVVAVYVAGP